MARRLGTSGTSIQLVTFTMVVTNNGPAPVNNANLMDLLPPGLTPVQIRSSQGFCGAGITCLLGALGFFSDTTTVVAGGTVIHVVRPRQRAIGGGECRCD